MSWLGPIPRMRDERHFGDRIARCFAERPANFPAMLAQAVARNPHGEALVCGPVRLSYRELEATASRVAGRLVQLGIGRGDRVALLGANSIAFVTALHGIMRLGAIAVPLNVREEKPEFAYILGNCGAVAVLHDAELAGKLPDSGDAPALLHRIVFDSGGAGGASDVAAIVPPVSAAAEVGEEDVAAILYTSGTTGRPKGAMISHLGLVHAALIYEACMGLTTADRSIVSVPMSHVTGLTAAIAAMLRAAGTLIVMPAFKADAFLELAAAERMTHTVMVPAMYNLILLQHGFERYDLTRWRIGGYGGAPMPEVTIARLARGLPDLRLMNAYGATETTGPVVLMPPAASIGRRSAIGHAVPVADIRIMDDDGRELGPGEPGEVWLTAPNVAAGYWQNPAATAESFVAGYWRSGDIGVVDGDGILTLLDRKKDMLNRGGYKIYSVEVENVLAEIPGVVEAAVVASPCPVLGERVHAVVVGDGVHTPDAGRIRDFCRGRLADYKIPETIEFLDSALPRNANGKVLKRALRQHPG